jgi:repressor LexA
MNVRSRSRQRGRRAPEQLPRAALLSFFCREHVEEESIVKTSRRTLPIPDPAVIVAELPLDRNGDALRNRKPPENTPNMLRRYSLLAGNLAEIRSAPDLLSEPDDVRGILGVQIETSVQEQLYAEWNNQVKGIIPSRLTSPHPISFAQAVSDLLISTGYSQQRLADAVGVSQSNIAKWKSGKLKVPGPICAQFSKLAPEEMRAWWLEQAGLASAEAETRETGIRWVPLLKDAAACGTPRAINEKEVEEMVPFPRGWLPNGGSIFAVRVSGDSMSPLLEEGYVALIDVAAHHAEKLVDRMVLARDGDEVTVKWLRRQDDMLLLVPQNTSPRHPIRVWTRSDNRAIVGEVVRWIGYPPPPRRKR